MKTIKMCQMNQGKRSLLVVGIVSLVILGFGLLSISEGSAGELSREELSQLLKARSNLLQEGKVSMDVVLYSWEKESDYKIFASELKNFINVSPKQFKSWLSEESNRSLVKAKKIGDQTQTYIFKGQQDHLIVNWNVEKIDYFYDSKKQEYVGLDAVPQGVSKITHYEYSTDGDTSRSYIELDQKGMINISPNLHYFKIYEVDRSAFYCKQLPKESSSLQFVAQNNQCIFKSSDENAVETTLVFDISLEGSVPYLITRVKSSGFFQEIISGAFSKDNTNVSVPYFTSVATKHPNSQKIEQQIFIIKSWNIGPVSQEELIIHPLPNTTVSDITFEPAINYPFYMHE